MFLQSLQLQLRALRGLLRLAQLLVRGQLEVEFLLRLIELLLRRLRRAPRLGELQLCRGARIDFDQRLAHRHGFAGRDQQMADARFVGRGNRMRFARLRDNAPVSGNVISDRFFLERSERHGGNWPFLFRVTLLRRAAGAMA